MSSRQLADRCWPFSSKTTMWLIAAVLFSLLGAVICRPPVVTRYGNFSTDPVSQEYQAFLNRNTRTRRSSSYPKGFKVLYFNRTVGVSHDVKPPDGHYIKVVGSPKLQPGSLQLALMIVRDLMQNTPEYIFNRVAESTGGAGVFSAEEKITIFPEFEFYKDKPECKDRCDDECYITCTFDGRKTEDLAGATAGLAVMVEDNLYCKGDPYYGNLNGLVHEFAHMVAKEGMTSEDHTTNEANYENAKARELWDLNTYAMANQAEYFAESTGAYFMANLQTGGMTPCTDEHCQTEQEAREFIRSRDPNLYNFLTHIWTDGNPALPGNIEVCYDKSPRSSKGSLQLDNPAMVLN